MAVGAVLGAEDLLLASTMEEIIREKFPKAYEANAVALHEGIALGRQAKWEGYYDSIIFRPLHGG